MLDEEESFLKRNLAKTLILTVVAQWFLWVGFSVFANSSYIGCSNWHGELLPCSIIEVLIYSIPNVLILNLVTVGGAFFAVWALVAGTIAIQEQLAATMRKRLQYIWGGLAMVFLVAIVAKQLFVVYEIRKAAQQMPDQERTVIIKSTKGATTVDP